MISEKIQQSYNKLLTQATPSPNATFICKIVASWLAGENQLPQRLGLPPEDFKNLMGNFLHLTSCNENAVSGITMDTDERPEIEELVELFMEHKAGKDELEHTMAVIMAVGCQASDHLWQDMGFWSRADLSAMIRENFPTLFDLNIKNMKWKKFFYKQMCMDLDATYTCRVPSCAVCVDYRECYPSTEELEEEFNKATIEDSRN